MTENGNTNGKTGASSSQERQTAELLRLVETVTSARLALSPGSSEPEDQDKPQPQGEAAVSHVLNSLLDEGRGSHGFMEAISVLSQHSVNNASPGFLGKLVSAPSPPGIAADLFLSIINNNGHVWRASPALSAVEKHVSGELAKLFGLEGPHAGGVTVPGGAAGAMLAMLVARNMLVPESKQQGLNSTKRYAVFVSESSHYSVSNAAQIVGLGNESVVRIPTLDDGTMDVQQLEASVDDCLGKGRQPLFINATAGNTVNGAFDAIDKIGAIARRVNAWFHVDACWGGAVVFSEKLKHLIKGSELADSIAFNPHKMLGVPLVCAFLLARDLRTFWLANKLQAGYLFHDSKASTNDTTGIINDNWRESKLLDAAPKISDIRDLASLTVQCSRRSDATKMWLHWIYYGTREIGKQVEQAVDSAQHLAKLVQSHPQMQLVGDPSKVFAQVCFYWGADASSTNTSDNNSRNTRLLYEALTEQGWKIDFAPDKTHGELIRVACNRLTTRRGVESLLSGLVEAGTLLIDSGK